MSPRKAYEKPDIIEPRPFSAEDGEALAEEVKENPDLVPDANVSEEERDVANERTKLREQLKAQLDPALYKRFVNLVYYMSKVGLEFGDACKVTGCDPAVIIAKCKDLPIMQELLDATGLQYKAGLLKTISLSAIDGKEDKHALWLLERKFPEEFNPKKGSGKSDKDEQDLLGEAIQYIQNNSDSNPLIKEDSGKSFLIKKNNREDILISIDRILK